MTNSKLTQIQKAQLKVWKRLYPEIEIYSSELHGATVAITRTSEWMAKFSVSIMGDSETKFKRKVGEYYALERMMDGANLPCKVASIMAYWPEVDFNPLEAYANQMFVLITEW